MQSEVSCLWELSWTGPVFQLLLHKQSPKSNYLCLVSFTTNNGSKRWCNRSEPPGAPVLSASVYDGHLRSEYTPNVTWHDLTDCYHDTGVPYCHKVPDGLCLVDAVPYSNSLIRHHERVDYSQVTRERKSGSMEASKFSTWTTPLTYEINQGHANSADSTTCPLNILSGSLVVGPLATIVQGALDEFDA